MTAVHLAMVEQGIPESTSVILNEKMYAVVMHHLITEALGAHIEKLQ